MPEHHGGRDIPGLIESIASRSRSETELLVSRLESRCWPGGSLDRSEPTALEWVRRWGPARLTAAPLDCSCRDGRCALCN